MKSFTFLFQKNARRKIVQMMDSSVKIASVGARDPTSDSQQSIATPSSLLPEATQSELYLPEVAVDVLQLVAVDVLQLEAVDVPQLVAVETETVTADLGLNAANVKGMRVI